VTGIVLGEDTGTITLFLKDVIIYGTIDEREEHYSMPKSDQGVSKDRYQVIPRTLIFITRGDEVLLLKGAATKRLWANRFNGIGGHIEKGESVLSAAQRELKEEAGIEVESLNLSGTVLVDASDTTGILIFIFRGEYSGGELVDSHEGSLHWIKQDRILDYPLVEDLQFILPRVLKQQKNEEPFSARSFYNEDEKLWVEFDDQATSAI